MRKLKNLLAIGILACLPLTALAAEIPGEFTVNDVRVLSVTHPASEADIRRIYGEPTRVLEFALPTVLPGWPQTNNHGRGLFYQGTGFIVYKDVDGNFPNGANDELQYILILDRSTLTPRGIGVGDSIDTVFEKYGKTPNVGGMENEEEKTLGISYDQSYIYSDASFDNNHSVGAVTILVKKKKVVAIYISDLTNRW